MDVTLSELLASFMESPLVLWVRLTRQPVPRSFWPSADFSTLWVSCVCVLESMVWIVSCVCLRCQVRTLGPLGSGDDVDSEERVSMYMELVDGVFLHKIMTHM
ncbi:hypothetical protein GOODEAATRI_030281 [Goodea atripinnis]|uniref:Uncharacterized protein n=1 Tax=Goodea atripinnis TaxID=208336 RepID=A0ABV0NEX0_9TELE